MYRVMDGRYQALEVAPAGGDDAADLPGLRCAGEDDSGTAEEGVARTGRYRREIGL